MEGRWSRTCHTPKHLVDLYQASIKEKRKGIETNFVDHNDLEDPMNYLDLSNGVDMTHLDVSDFFENVNGKFDNVIVMEISIPINYFSFIILWHCNKYFYFDMFYLHLK